MQNTAPPTLNSKKADPGERVEGLHYPNHSYNLKKHKCNLDQDENKSNSRPVTRRNVFDMPDHVQKNCMNICCYEDPKQKSPRDSHNAHYTAVASLNDGGATRLDFYTTCINKSTLKPKSPALQTPVLKRVKHSRNEHILRMQSARRRAKSCDQADCEIGLYSLQCMLPKSTPEVRSKDNISPDVRKKVSRAGSKTPGSSRSKKVSTIEWEKLQKGLFLPERPTRIDKRCGGAMQFPIGCSRELNCTQLPGGDKYCNEPHAFAKKGKIQKEQQRQYFATFQKDYVPPSPKDYQPHYQYQKDSYQKEYQPAPHKVYPIPYQKEYQSQKISTTFVSQTDGCTCTKPLAQRRKCCDPSDKHFLRTKPSPYQINSRSFAPQHTTKMKTPLDQSFNQIPAEIYQRTAGPICSGCVPQTVEQAKKASEQENDFKRLSNIPRDYSVDYLTYLAAKQKEASTSQTKTMDFETFVARQSSMVESPRKESYFSAVLAAETAALDTHRLSMITSNNERRRSTPATMAQSFEEPGLSKQVDWTDNQHNNVVGGIQPSADLSVFVTKLIAKHERNKKPDEDILTAVNFTPTNTIASERPSIGADTVEDEEYIYRPKSPKKKDSYLEKLKELGAQKRESDISLSESSISAYSQSESVVSSRSMDDLDAGSQQRIAKSATSYSTSLRDGDGSSGIRMKDKKEIVDFYGLAKVNMNWDPSFPTEKPDSSVHKHLKVGQVVDYGRNIVISKPKEPSYEELVEDEEDVQYGLMERQEKNDRAKTMVEARRSDSRRAKRKTCSKRPGLQQTFQYINERVPESLLHLDTGATEEHEYLQFSLRITEDIIRNDLFTPTQMKRVFNSHVEANRGRLNAGKMANQIKSLCTELDIPFTFGTVPTNITETTPCNPEMDDNTVCCCIENDGIIIPTNHCACGVSQFFTNLALANVESQHNKKLNDQECNCGNKFCEPLRCPGKKYVTIEKIIPGQSSFTTTEVETEKRHRLPGADFDFVNEDELRSVVYSSESINLCDRPELPDGTCCCASVPVKAKHSVTDNSGYVPSFGLYSRREHTEWESRPAMRSKMDGESVLSGSIDGTIKAAAPVRIKTPVTALKKNLCAGTGECENNFVSIECPVAVNRSLLDISKKLYSPNMKNALFDTSKHIEETDSSKYTENSFVDVAFNNPSKLPLENSRNESELSKMDKSRRSTHFSFSGAKSLPLIASEMQSLAKEDNFSKLRKDIGLITQRLSVDKTVQTQVNPSNTDCAGCQCRIPCNMPEAGQTKPDWCRKEIQEREKNPCGNCECRRKTPEDSREAHMECSQKVRHNDEFNEKQIQNQNQRYIHTTVSNNGVAENTAVQPIIITDENKYEKPANTFSFTTKNVKALFGAQRSCTTCRFDDNFFGTGESTSILYPSRAVDSTYNKCLFQQDNLLLSDNYNVIFSPYSIRPETILHFFPAACTQVNSCDLLRAPSMHRPKPIPEERPISPRASVTRMRYSPPRLHVISTHEAVEMQDQGSYIGVEYSYSISPVPEYTRTSNSELKPVPDMVASPSVTPPSSIITETRAKINSSQEFDSPYDDTTSTPYAYRSASRDAVIEGHFLPTNTSDGELHDDDVSFYDSERLIELSVKPINSYDSVEKTPIAKQLSSNVPKVEEKKLSSSSESVEYNNWMEKLDKVPSIKMTQSLRNSIDKAISDTDKFRGSNQTSKVSMDNDSTSATHRTIIKMDESKASFYKGKYKY